MRMRLQKVFCFPVIFSEGTFRQEKLEKIKKNAQVVGHDFYYPEGFHNQQGELGL